ncbi:MAG: hypothetical protein AAF639_44710, partial [Chloroflexota bacterium]
EVLTRLGGLCKMAFSDYKHISQVQTEFNIRLEEQNFIVADELQPPDSYLEDLAFNMENIDVYSSEASRSELLISPTLREVYKGYYKRYAFWIQRHFSYNDTLSDVPDYMFATKSPLGKTVLATPIIVLVEAKRSDFEQGWGQCLAELVAAQKVNNDVEFPVYGIVTNGELWKFGKLVGDTFTMHIEGYTIVQIAKLFGAINFLLHSADKAGK